MPPTIRLRPACRSGFTLVELSIVLVILSLLTASGLALGTSMVERAAYVDTAKQLAQLEESLRDYYVVNGRLPCPAPWNTLPGHADFGKEEPDCTSASADTLRNNGAWVGMIPVHTLGLSASAASDKFGSRIIYAVTTGLTDASSFGDTAGAISIYGESDASPIQTGMAYVLYSHGRDRKGARAYATGGISIPCGASANKDVMNCTFSNASRYRDVPFNSGDQAAFFFDDLIRWAPKYHFMAFDTSSTNLWAKRADNDHIYSVGTDGNPATTNVGIGTSDPTQGKLHVAGGPIYVGAMWLGKSGATDTAPDIHMDQSGAIAVDHTMHMIINGSGIGGYSGFQIRNGGLNVDTAQEIFRVSEDGSVRFARHGGVGRLYGTVDADQELVLYGGPSFVDGSTISLYGRTQDTLPGRIRYRGATNATDTTIVHDFRTYRANGDQNALAYIRANGNLWLAGSLSPSSDARLKKDFAPIEDALRKLLTIDGIYFRWNEKSPVADKEKRHIGVLAQAVQKVFPELVDEDEEGMLTLNMGGLMPVVIEATRELNERNAALESRVAVLEDRLAALEDPAAGSLSADMTNAGSPDHYPVAILVLLGIIAALLLAKRRKGT